MLIDATTVPILLILVPNIQKSKVNSKINKQINNYGQTVVVGRDEWHLAFVRSFTTELYGDQGLWIWTLPELPIDAKVQHEQGESDRVS